MDINGADYEIDSPRHLTPGNPVYTFEHCQKTYLEAIRDRGRGIVLLHVRVNGIDPVEIPYLWFSPHLKRSETCLAVQAHSLCWETPPPSEISIIWFGK
jgi:hypothetical protein